MVMIAEKSTADDLQSIRHEFRLENPPSASTATSMEAVSHLHAHRPTAQLQPDTGTAVTAVYFEKLVSAILDSTSDAVRAGPMFTIQELGRMTALADTQDILREIFGHRARIEVGRAEWNDEIGREIVVAKAHYALARPIDADHLVRRHREFRSRYVREIPASVRRSIVLESVPTE